MNIAKLLRTPHLKNICERLLLKMSTCVTNLPRREATPRFYYPFKPFSILNFTYKGMVLLCNMFCKGFSALFFSLKHYIFIIKKLFYNTHQVRYYHFIIVEAIAESMNVMQMSKYNKKLLSS